MDKFLAGVRREYWEHRRIIVGLPLLLSALSTVAFILAIVAARYFEGGDKDFFLAESGDLFSYEFIGFYVSVAWLAGVYYLLSCLHSDRKDKSILFWKSLPVSETQNVVTKLLVACLGFVAIAIVIAWLTSIALLVLFLAFNSLGAVAVDQYAGLEFSAVKFFVWPLLSMLLAFLWGAPVFAYVLLVSAIARRSPFLLLVVPLLVLSILERLFFSTSYLIGFFSEHLPFGVVSTVAASPGMGSLMQYYLIDNGIGLGIGLVLAAVFAALAIWFRNYKFEI